MSKEHPAKTSPVEFRKQYPDVQISVIDKSPIIDLQSIDVAIRDKFCETNFSCEECLKKYWTEELE